MAKTCTMIPSIPHRRHSTKGLVMAVSRACQHKYTRKRDWYYTWYNSNGQQRQWRRLHPSSSLLVVLEPNSKPLDTPMWPRFNTIEFGLGGSSGGNSVKNSVSKRKTAKQMVESYLQDTVLPWVCHPQDLLHRIMSLAQQRFVGGSCVSVLCIIPQRIQLMDIVVVTAPWVYAIYHCY